MKSKNVEENGQSRNEVYLKKLFKYGDGTQNVRFVKTIFSNSHINQFLFLTFLLFRKISSVIDMDSNVVEDFVNLGVLEHWKNFVSNSVGRISSNDDFQEFIETQFEIFECLFMGFFE